MKERLRGYAAAVLGQARDDGSLGRVRRELDVLRSALAANDELRDVLADPDVPSAGRRAVLGDLLAGAAPGTARLATQAVAVEGAADTPAGLDSLATLAADEEEAGEGAGVGGAGPLAPPAGRLATRERLEGFASAVFEDVGPRGAVDEVEDELFRFARTVEGSEQLGPALVDLEVPARDRQRLAVDLLAGKAQPATVRLVSYAVASARGRGLVPLLDWLVERAAAERGLRVAEVRSAAELDQDQRRRLAGALSRLTGRDVELRVDVDADLVGGLVVLVGDMVLDASVRHRLDGLRSELAGPAGPGGAQGSSGQEVGGR